MWYFGAWNEVGAFFKCGTSTSRMLPARPLSNDQFRMHTEKW